MDDVDCDSKTVPGYITAVEAGKRLGVKRSRVYQLIAEGRLPALRVGRDWLIPEVLLHLVHDKRRQPPSEYSDDWLTASEVARQIGCSRENVCAMVRNGRIPGQRVGHLILIPRSVKDDLLARQTERCYDKQQYLSVPEAARALGLALSTLYHRIYYGKCPCEKMGGRWVIPRDYVQQQLESSGAVAEEV